eukprot:TRINITY_DN122622_c0_g1_i1.p1 TRINITY_DN122622_c0_g1~~TRINITY_DN122622_c0_g1_i1.p1  ORF type:complete len:694 (+),score=88.46 TRINITY_DN122622_c0_g1_i1:97-2178(+)
MNFSMETHPFSQRACSEPCSACKSLEPCTGCGWPAAELHAAPDQDLGPLAFAVRLCEHDRTAAAVPPSLREVVSQLKILQAHLAGAHERQVHALHKMFSSVGVPVVDDGVLSSPAFCKMDEVSPQVAERQNQCEGCLPPPALKTKIAGKPEDCFTQEKLCDGRTTRCVTSHSSEETRDPTQIVELKEGAQRPQTTNDSENGDATPRGDVRKVSMGFVVDDSSNEAENDEKKERDGQDQDQPPAGRRPYVKGLSRSLSYSADPNWADQTITNVKARKTVAATDLSEMMTSISAEVSLPLGKVGRRMKPSIPLYDRLHNFTESVNFDLFCGSVIVINAIFMAVETDHSLTGPVGQEPELWMTTLGNAFTIFFVCELLLRMGGGLRRFFLSGNTWNYFDFIIVALSVMEKILQDGGALSNVRMVRLLRLTRLVKLLRVLRIVRFVGALRTLIHSLMGTMRQVVWAFVLIGCLMFVFGIVFGQVVGEARLADPLATEEDEALILYWSTLPRCMYTLYGSVAGGVSWLEAAAPLQHLGADAFLGFLAYIALVQWVVLNVVTGCFCESAAAAARRDVTLAVEAHRADRDQFLQKCRAIFRSIDTGGDGKLQAQEMKPYLDSEAAKSLFASMELDFENVQSLFELLDEDGDEVIDLDEFLLGCLKLRGGAKAFDLAKVLQETRRMAEMMEHLMDTQSDKH